MCTGFEIAGLALAAASTAVSVVQNNAQAQAAAEASNRNLELVYAENQRLMEENNEIATEKSSDRVREANKELGTLRVAEELGIAGASMTGLVVQTGYNEGLDLSRIEANRIRQQKALEAANEAGRVSALNETTLAANQAAVGNTSAVLGFVQSGLQIGSKAYERSQREKRAQNRTT